MNLFYEIPKLKDVNLSIGVFDTIHRGHVKLINKLIKMDGRKAILSFFPPPFIYFGKEDKVTFLPYEKKMIIENFPIDALIFLPFNKKIHLLDPERFIKLILSRMKVKSIIVGKNFRFGYKRRGDVNFLSKFGKRFGFEVTTIPEEKNNNKKISSSEIRDLIKKGEIKKANKFLFKPYFVCGKIDDHLLKVEKIKLLPKEGRYMVEIEGSESIAYVKRDGVFLPNFMYEKNKNYCIIFKRSIKEEF